MSDVIYETDPKKIFELIKAGHTVRHPRVLFEQQIQERGKAARDFLRAKGILLNPPEQGEGFVYVFVAGEHVKVGLSQFDVEARWSMIKSSNPLLERPYFCTPPIGKRARAVEKAAHSSLTEYHASGEWFLCSQEQAIQAVQQAVLEVSHA